ncbi:MAG TPA: MBL fold metallo-hydrolase [bacterium]|nr:MBL fold metallo-hydrolase [bacterium]
MPPKHHNPGLPITLKFDQETIVAFSISALSTYALVPELNCAFDMGDCLLDAVPLQHVFVTHAHGDHTRCLFRHDSLRHLMGMEPATYYVPDSTVVGFRNLSEAWSKLEYPRARPAAPPVLRGLTDGDVVWLHRQLAAKAFAVKHTVSSLGYTLYDVRKKLKDEYRGLPGVELARMRRDGVAFEDEQWLPRLTFIGDSTIETLYQRPEVGRSRILFLEVTFLMDGEQELARNRGHTHVEDLVQFLRDCPDVLGNEHIVLKHFSMRYDRGTIKHVLRSKLPADFMERVTVLL